VGVGAVGLLESVVHDVLRILQGHCQGWSGDSSFREAFRGGGQADRVVKAALWCLVHLVHCCCTLRTEAVRHGVLDILVDGFLTAKVVRSSEQDDLVMASLLACAEGDSLPLVARAVQGLDVTLCLGSHNANLVARTLQLLIVTEVVGSIHWVPALTRLCSSEHAEVVGRAATLLCHKTMWTLEPEVLHKFGLLGVEDALETAVLNHACLVKDTCLQWVVDAFRMLTMFYSLPGRHESLFSM
jgi:hypothetical protein